MINPSLLKGDLQGWTEFQTGDCNAVILVSYQGLVALEPLFNESEFAEQVTAFSSAGIKPLSAGQRSIWSQRISAALANPGLVKELPLDLRGTPFQLAVWSALLEIPRGKTLSYAQLARAIGKPKAVRAVGSACGANPLPFLVPCHRILRSDGSLGGFAFGSTMKQQLLDREKVEGKKPYEHF